MDLHIKTALDYIRRSPFQALAAFFVLTLTFFVSTALIVIVIGTNNLLEYVETRPQVIAFLKKDAKKDDIVKLQKQLALDPRIREVGYTSKEAALKIYERVTSDNPRLGELVSPSIFSASLEFSLKDLSSVEAIVEEVRKEAIVEKVGFTAAIGSNNALESVVKTLKSISYYMRLSGGVLVGVLAVTSFLVLLIIVGMRVSTRKSEIEILDLMGATFGFIALPIVVEVTIYCLVGALVGWLTTFVVVLYLTPSLSGYLSGMALLPQSTSSLVLLFVKILCMELVAALLLALFGSGLALSRMRKKR